jgi:hypothetical protein
MIVEYKLNNQKNSQIFTKNLLRKLSEISENLELNLNSNTHFSYNLDFLNGLSNKTRKIKNVIINIKTLVPGIKMIFYSISSNDLVIFPEENFSTNEEKTEGLNLLDTLMNNIVDFYVKFIINSSTNRLNCDKEKSRTKVKRNMLTKII